MLKDKYDNVVMNDKQLACRIVTSLQKKPGMDQLDFAVKHNVHLRQANRVCMGLMKAGRIGPKKT